MNTLQRHYNSKDVDMLITAATMVDAAIANKDFLISQRATWADPFLQKLKDRIDAATQNYLGVDSAKDLRNATQIIRNIQSKALNDLSLVKIQIKEDFKNNKPRLEEILNNLGYNAYHKDARNKDQEALINLLFRFKINLTPELKNEIIDQGTAPESLEKVINHADALKNANINQETFKGMRKNITATSLKEFNEIYDQVISVSKIAARLLNDQPTLKQLFSYNKVSKTLNGSIKKPENNS